MDKNLRNTIDVAQVFICRTALDAVLVDINSNVAHARHGDVFATRTIGKVGTWQSLNRLIPLFGLQVLSPRFSIDSSCGRIGM